MPALFPTSLVTPTGSIETLCLYKDQLLMSPHYRVSRSKAMESSRLFGRSVRRSTLSARRGQQVAEDVGRVDSKSAATRLSEATGTTRDVLNEIYSTSSQVHSSQHCLPTSSSSRKKREGNSIDGRGKNDDTTSSCCFSTTRVIDPG